MEKILVVGKAFHDSISSFKSVEMPENGTSEEEIHDFTNHLVEDNDFDNIILCLRNSDFYSGLSIAYHIRLTRTFQEKRLCPILIISSITIEEIMSSCGVFGNILFTEGTYFEELYDAANLEKVLSLMQGINAENYEAGFYNKINIRPGETTGRHSIANEWGAYSLARAAGSKVFDCIGKIPKAHKSIYFKFVRENRFELETNSTNLKTIDRISATGKRILLIDDEAEKGWSLVLSDLLNCGKGKPNTLDVHSSRVSGFNDLNDKIKGNIENGYYDLFLVDLRLNGLVEDSIMETERFSGFHIVQKLKNINEGNQIIMLSASNKIWNYKGLKEVIDGYYIKESPLHSDNVKNAIYNWKNFKSNIEISLNNRFLYNVYAKLKVIKKSIRGLSSDETRRERMLANVEISFDLLQKASEKSEFDKYFNYSYLQLYHLIEDYVEDQFCCNENEQYIIDVNGNKVVVFELNSEKSTEKKLIYRSAIKFDDNHGYAYVLKEDTDFKPKNGRFDIYTMMSAILIFKFGFSNSNELKWNKVNRVRNTKAGHVGKEVVSLVNLNDLLNLLSFVLNSKNVKINNIKNDLSNKSDEDRLKSAWGIK